MALVPWETYAPLASVHLPGCPDITLKQALAFSAADFCERSQVWRVDLDPETTVAGEPLYEFYFSGVLERFVELTCDGGRLEATHPSLLQSGWNAESGAPTHFFIVEDASVRLYPTPDAEYVLGGTAVLKPSKVATGTEKFIYETHAETIVSGALARLLAIPGTVWSNPQLAVAFSQIYERGIDAAFARDYRDVVLRINPTPI